MKKFILLISAIGFFLIGLSGHLRANTLPAQNENSNVPDLSDSSVDPFQSFFSKWNPDKEIARMQQNMQSMMRFAASTQNGTWDPAPMNSEFQDTGKEYQAKLNLPGMKKNKIDIKVSDHQLRISGQQTVENQFKDDSSQRVEKSQSYFQQIIPLPQDADEDTLRADYKQNILTVHLSKISPKRLPQKPERKVAAK